MTVRKTVLGVTSRKRDFAITFSLPALFSVRMMLLLGTVQITVNRKPSGITASQQRKAMGQLTGVDTSPTTPSSAAQDDRAASELWRRGAAVVGQLSGSPIRGHRRRRLRVFSDLSAPAPIGRNPVAPWALAHDAKQSGLPDSEESSCDTRPGALRRSSELAWLHRARNRRGPVGRAGAMAGATVTG
jgi:hypothetical protein